MDGPDMKHQALTNLVCLTGGLVLIGMGLRTLGYGHTATLAFGIAWIFPGVVLCLGVLAQVIVGQSVKAQGAAHGAAKQGDGG